jgi:hypothetical protein
MMRRFSAMPLLRVSVRCCMRSSTSGPCGPAGLQPGHVQLGGVSKRAELVVQLAREMPRSSSRT